MTYPTPETRQLPHYLDLAATAPDVYAHLGLIEICRLDAERLVESAGYTWTIHAPTDFSFVTVTPPAG